MIFLCTVHDQLNCKSTAVLYAGDALVVHLQTERSVITDQ